MRIEKRVVAAAILSIVLAIPIHAAAAAPSRIGFLTSTAPGQVDARLEAFRAGMRALRHVEGKTYVIEQRHARGRRGQLDLLAEQLAALPVDIFLTNGGSATVAADKAGRAGTRHIPVVFALAADPVETGLVSSLSRPGGNITGLTNSHSILVPKRLELLRELIPDVRRVAVLWSPRASNGPPQLEALRAAAARLGIAVIPVALERPADLATAFAKIKAARVDAVDVFSWSLSGTLAKEIASEAVASALPTIHANPNSVVAGGLLAYGADRRDLYRRAAYYVDRILKGAKPGDLPVERPTRFDLVVNATTARKLGIALPPSILLRFDRVVE